MARQQDPPPPGRLSASWSSGQAAGLAPLDAGFYDRPVLQVAPELLGALVQHAGVTVRLTEVEAYDGANDPGSHAFRGATPRTAVMFGPPGRLYVYFSYGMHYCANLVCGPSGTASAVLLRAGEVVEGIEAARARRCSGRPVGAAALPDRDLARGPARLTQALRIGRQQNGSASTDPAGALRVCPGQPVSPSVLRHGPRVGVAGAGGDAQAYPWRFWLDGEATVSAYRPAVRRTPARQPVRGAGRP